MGNRAMKIEDICKVSSSKRIFAREYVETGVPFWRGKEVTEHATGKNDSKGLFISVRRYNELKQTGNVPSDDDVLITAVGTIGSIYQIKHEDLPFYFKDGNIIRLSNWNTERVNPTYVSLFLRSQIGQQAIKEVEIGSTQKALTIKDIAKVPILLPELKTQNDIAAAIGVIDAKIKINQQINKNLLKLGINIAIRTSNINKSTTCRISDMKDFLTVSDHVANGSFKTLKDNVTIVDKPDYSLFLRNTDLKRNLMGDKRWITKHSYDFLKKSHLYGGEVIISNVGDVGSVHRVPYLDEHMVAGNNVIFIQSADSWITDYLYLYFLSNIGQHALSTITSGSAQQKFNKTDFRAIELPIIPKNFVKKNLTPILKKIDSNRVEEDCLITLRDLLLPRLLSGEIDLSILEEVLKNAK
ncbi:restriction endonuclease subunit S [Lactiplantibacillus plantarum]|nr:restriction endonuclease subunit S [Lactiplantibacillus plantarum]